MRPVKPCDKTLSALTTEGSYKVFTMTNYLQGRTLYKNNYFAKKTKLFISCFGIITVCDYFLADLSLIFEITDCSKRQINK